MAPTRPLALLQLLLPLFTAEAFAFHGTSACRLIALTSAHHTQQLLLLTQAHVLAFGAAAGSTAVAHRHGATQTAAARRTATTSMRVSQYYARAVPTLVYVVSPSVALPSDD
jgi:Na+/phosphate symporter